MFGRILGTVTLLSLATLAAASEDHIDVTIVDRPPNKIDNLRANVSQRVNTVARWIDEFFDDPNYVTEEADSRLIVRQAANVSDRDATTFRTRVSAKVRLPRAERRLSLIFEGDDDRSLFDEESDDFAESLDESVEHPSLGVQYFHKDSDRFNTSFSAGFRSGHPSIYLGPFARFQHAIGESWSGRYSQRLRWYTNDGWESITRANFDRSFGELSNFRQDFAAIWKENQHASEGIRYQTTTSFTTMLASESAIRYGWTSVYRTLPKSDWQSSTLFVRYRRSLTRDWIMFEVIPYLAFEQRHDWQANPGIRLTLEILFEGDAVSPARSHPTISHTRSSRTRMRSNDMESL